MQSVATYPVRVDGQLDPGLSRWRWLVKWLLAIPHLVVLVFLWIAFVLLSIVAMVAIVCTGRYPRGIFDFNLGVLRWTWRVWFYAYGANGTDRYPPFSLDREDAYPAHLDIPYPEHLSRGLALVKWWLLAIPHYLIVGLFLGGGLFAWRFTGGAGAGGGLIGLLVLIAAVALLFTGRYPRGLFDLVLGLDRWALRVVAYAGLMTDAYPPFRLDAGADDPGAPIMSDAATTGEQATAAPRRLGGGRIVLIVVAVLVGLLSLGLLAAGAGVLAVDRTSRDANGFVMTPRDRLSTTTSAITASYRRAGDALAARGVLDVRGPNWLYAGDRLGTIRVRAAAPDGTPLFVGVAPTRAVDRYLAGVGHDALTGYDGGSPRYATTPGGRPEIPPQAARIWVASTVGGGERTLTWPVRSGSWTLVVMNADGRPGVTADAAIGARLSFLGWVAGGLLAAGAVMAALTALLLVVALRHRPDRHLPRPDLSGHNAAAAGSPESDPPSSSAAA